MNAPINRRFFLRASSTAGAGLGLGGLSFLGSFPAVRAAETQLPAHAVRLDPGIEPLVRLIESTPRDRLLEEIGHRVRHGLPYRDVLASLLLAGVRNVQPRPVGFKFHCVLVVNSAHLASLASPDADRWLPIFWALDYFKSSQASDEAQGDWTLRAVDDSALPPAHHARAAFTEAMDQWDVPAADTAVAALARTMPPMELFRLLAEYGARDYRDIGHKAIYVSNSWRTLQAIGWQHAEPVLRSLAYALLYHEGGNPARRDADADRPGRVNQRRLDDIPADWQSGRRDSTASIDLLETLRQGSADDAGGKVIELLRSGIGPDAVWDGLFQGVGELLMRQPGIVSLHAATTTNALHFAWQQCDDDRLRRWLLLQNASFLPMFRSDRRPGAAIRIDQLESIPPRESGSRALEEIFSRIDGEPLTAARMTLGWLRQGGDSGAFLDQARRLVFLKGTNSHDYKFSSAVLEDFRHISPGLRDPYLAASVFQLRGSGAPDNRLVARTRAALDS